ncbi:ABC transporter ATP-binding protein [candidate division KSB1 bacterium]|nr:ABC transporter ATP-binding protein [candidate division KSB1 bacterium]
MKNSALQITIRDLQKVYPNGQQALKDIQLDIQPGMFGLLGPNGAGKTTLMRILVTLLQPTSGVVKINDWDLQKNRREIRAILGYLPQDFSVFSRLKTWEFLDYTAALGGLKDRRQRMQAVDRMLEQVGLISVRERPANNLSGGMKRRLGIAQALIGAPKIIIVDEPTTGLDPAERLRFRNLLAELSRQEVIIMLSTHIVGDISSTCQKMALMHAGEIIFNASPSELVAAARGHVWEITVPESELPRIKEKYAVISHIPAKQGYEVKLIASELRDYSGHSVEPNLEDAYVYFMEQQEAPIETDIL